MIVLVNRCFVDDCWFSLVTMVVTLFVLLQLQLYHGQTTLMVLPSIVRHDEGCLDETLCMGIVTQQNKC